MEIRLLSQQELLPASSSCVGGVRPGCGALLDAGRSGRVPEVYQI